MLFVLSNSPKTATEVKPDSFADLKLSERFDLQEWVISTPSLLGEDLLVITSEFDRFDRTSERLEVLMLDRDGKLVVVELKRSAVGTAADLQALRYAAYCSTLSPEDTIELYAAFHGRRAGQEISRDEARKAIIEFVEDPAFEEVDNKPRIILAAEEFPPEMTATLLWLRTYQLDVSAVRLRPYGIGEHAVLESTVLIPLPEAEDYIVRRERKDVETSSRTSGRREDYRVFFQALMDELRDVHGFTKARMAQPQSWYYFASGITGISYGAAFTQRGLRAEVYIDVGSTEENKRIFDALQGHLDAVEREFGSPLSWERLDDRKASRVGIYNGATIDAPEAELEEARQWAVQNLLRLKEVFGPRLERLA